MGHLHSPGARVGFEHHLPDSQLLVAMPWEAWPHLRAAMQARTRSDSSWSGRLSSEEKRLAARILARIEAEGPLCSQDIPSARKAKTHDWDSTTLAKSTAVIRRVGEAQWEVIIRRSFADYLYRWLLDASEEYGVFVAR